MQNVVMNEVFQSFGETQLPVQCKHFFIFFLQYSLLTALQAVDLAKKISRGPVRSTTESAVCSTWITLEHITQCDDQSLENRCCNCESTGLRFMIVV
jgi:hypothetical protein